MTILGKRITQPTHTNLMILAFNISNGSILFNIDIKNNWAIRDRRKSVALGYWGIADTRANIEVLNIEIFDIGEFLNTEIFYCQQM